MFHFLAKKKGLGNDFQECIEKELQTYCVCLTFSSKMITSNLLMMISKCQMINNDDHLKKVMDVLKFVNLAMSQIFVSEI